MFSTYIDRTATAAVWDGDVEAGAGQLDVTSRAAGLVNDDDVGAGDVWEIFQWEVEHHVAGVGGAVEDRLCWWI